MVAGGRAVAAAVLLVASRAAGVTVTYSGYVVDDLCFDKCTSSPGCDKCALDKTDVLTEPQTHTVHCIRDVQVCIDSGYALMAQVGTASDPKYEIKYKFDSAGNDRVLDIIKATSLNEGLLVTATGDDSGDGVLRGVTAMSECTGGAAACDTVCTGCGTLPGKTDSSLQTSTKPAVVALHGALLIMAWGWFAPAAALIKRHAATVPRLNLGRKVWFAGYELPLAFLLHAGIMSTVAVFTIVAVSLALGTFDHRAIMGHIPIGIVVLVVTILQPIEGFFFRPAHGSPRRKYFNIVHHYVGGNVVVILGMVNIVLGCVNYVTLWDNCRAPIFFGFAFAGIAVMGLGGIGLELKSRFGKRDGDSKQ